MFPSIIGLAALATLGILVTGMVAMIRGGEFNQKYGNRLMRWRVVAQVIALGLVMLAMLFSGR